MRVLLRKQVLFISDYFDWNNAFITSFSLLHAFYIVCILFKYCLVNIFSFINFINLLLLYSLALFILFINFIFTLFLIVSLKKYV